MVFLFTFSFWNCNHIALKLDLEIFQLQTQVTFSNILLLRKNRRCKSFRKSENSSERSLHSALSIRCREEQWWRRKEASLWYWAINCYWVLRVQEVWDGIFYHNHCKWSDYHKWIGNSGEDAQILSHRWQVQRGTEDKLRWFSEPGRWRSARELEDNAAVSKPASPI